MSRFKLDRRTVIKGAGTSPSRCPGWRSWAAGAAPARRRRPSAEAVRDRVSAGRNRSPGANGDKYTPTGSETSFTMSPILMPLDPVKSKLLIVDGLNLTCGDQSKYAVEQHQGGAVGWLTGAVQPGAGNYPKSPSIDQILATRLSTGKAYAQPRVRGALGDGEVARQALADERAVLRRGRAERAPSAAARSAGHLHRRCSAASRAAAGAPAPTRTPSRSCARSRSSTSSTRSTTALKAKLGTADRDAARSASDPGPRASSSGS